MTLFNKKWTQYIFGLIGFKKRTQTKYDLFTHYWNNFGKYGPKISVLRKIYISMLQYNT